MIRRKPALWNRTDTTVVGRGVLPFCLKWSPTQTKEGKSMVELRYEFTGLDRHTERRGSIQTVVMRAPVHKTEHISRIRTNDEEAL